MPNLLIRIKCHNTTVHVPFSASYEIYIQIHALIFIIFIYCMYFSCFLNVENCHLLCTSIKHLRYQSTATDRYHICCYQFFMTVISIFSYCKSDTLEAINRLSQPVLYTFSDTIANNCKHFCYVMQSNGWYPIKLTTMYNDCTITIISLIWRALNHKNQILVSFCSQALS